MDDEKKVTKKEKKDKKKEKKSKKEKKTQGEADGQEEATHPSPDAAPGSEHHDEASVHAPPPLTTKPKKGILKKEGEAHEDRKGLSVAGLESVPEPEHADKPKKELVVEGKKGIVRRNVDGDSLKSHKRATEKPPASSSSSAPNPKNIITKRAK